ncbi:MAG: T9SS type A sorting domain-containing protein, partial [Ignavibacteria bacterium]|nr:T9SS type A sorting domain-containing protein [Ignavibacteria bacterium]
GNGCTGYENIIDSLLSKRGDTVRNCNYTYRVCIDTSFISFFSNTFSSKEYTNERGNFRSVYLKGIGRIRNGWAELMNYCFDTLKGCVINGVLYGDTSTLVGINQLSTELPERFELYQNYPNPFNPVTHFGFRIAEFGLVKLTVFDMLGKEVAKLVNQQLQPGSYEADWDASAFPSGVYYYKLESGNFTETKKMVLIK